MHVISFLLTVYTLHRIEAATTYCSVDILISFKYRGEIPEILGLFGRLFYTHIMGLKLHIIGKTELQLFLV